MNRLLKLFTFLLLLSVSSVGYAQSGDKLFMEGQKLQQTMTVPSQNAAIKKFQAAKIVYTTADKKKMCDNQIAICNKNIASLRKGSGRGSARTTTPAPPTIAPKAFSLSQNKVEFVGDKPGAVNIKVEAETMDWNFTVPAGVEGMDNFIKVTRSSDAKSIDIAVDKNDKTLDREQVVNVDFGDKREVVTVRQFGKPVTLSTNANQLTFGLKGGNKTLEIYTNSDSIITSNNDLTWYIESKPDWIVTKVEVKKKKGFFGSAFSALKEAVSGSASAASEEDVKISNLKLTVSAIAKSSPAYNTGRKGEIVFASQDKRYRIEIIQEK